MTVIDDSSSNLDHDDIEELLRRIKVRQLNDIDIKSTSFLIEKCYFINISLSAIGIAYCYAAIVSKFMPDTGVYILDSIKKDNYFCYLIPLMILPTFIVIYLKWLSMSLFQHTQN